MMCSRASIKIQLFLASLPSFTNFITTLISRLIAYTFFEKKPAIKFEEVNLNQFLNQTHVNNILK